jgi:hypothetical protein
MQEASYRSHDYLAYPPKSLKRAKAGTTPQVDAGCRFKMAEWCYQILDSCKFSRATVEIAMSYVDRYLSTEVGSPALDDRKFFQLAAMTCLYTAIKIHEPEAMQPRIVSQLSKVAYTEKEVTDMELEILYAVNWHMNPPTVHSFLNNFLAMLPEGTMSPIDRVCVYEHAKFQIQLAIHEYSLVTIDASTMAFAALTNAYENVAYAGTMDIMMMLAKVSSTDIQSTLLTESNDKLYQVSGVLLTGPSMSHSTSKSLLYKPILSRLASVHVSPRSVVC